MARHNNVTYALDTNPADGLRRPFRISTSAGWDSGTYAYDGAGNVHSIGSQIYRYDRLSRLVLGEADAGGVDRTQTATYDPYGNLTRLVTNGTVQTTPGRERCHPLLGSNAGRARVEGAFTSPRMVARHEELFTTLVTDRLGAEADFGPAAWAQPFSARSKPGISCSQ